MISLFYFISFFLIFSGLIDFDSEYTFFLPTQISTVCVLDKADFPTIVFIFGCLNGHIYVFHGYERDSVQCITEHTKNGNKIFLKILIINKLIVI